MKLVTFTRDVLPVRTGETRLVPDAVAADLEANGEIAASAPSWPEASSPDAVAVAETAEAPAPRPGRRQTYLTK